MQDERLNALQSARDNDLPLYNQDDVVASRVDYPVIDDMLSSSAFNRKEKKLVPLAALERNGVVINDTLQNYLDDNAIAAGAIKEIFKSPFHYFYYTRQQIKEEEETYFTIGKLARLAFLDQGLFNSKYPVLKKAYQALPDILRKNCNSHGDGIIPKILKGAAPATSFYGKDPVTGLRVKVRADSFNIVENIGVNAVISFKTTAAQSPDKFMNATIKYQYELQEAMCQRVISDITGRRFDVTIIIMLQTVPPYQPAVFWWDAGDLAAGKRTYKAGMKLVQHCIAKASAGITGAGYQ